MSCGAWQSEAVVWTPRKGGRGGGRVAATKAVVFRGFGGDDRLLLNVDSEVAELASPSRDFVSRLSTDGRPGVSAAWLLHAAEQRWGARASALIAGESVLTDGDVTHETTLYAVVERPRPLPSPAPPSRAKWGGGVVVATTATLHGGRDGAEVLHLLVHGDAAAVSSPSSEAVLRTTLAKDELGVRSGWLLHAAATFWFDAEVRWLVLVAGDEILKEGSFTAAEDLYVAELARPRLRRCPSP